MRRLALLLLLLLLPTVAAADEVIGTAHITSQTTTTLVTLAAGKTIWIVDGSICVDAGGATTGIQIRDSAGTNLFGTNVVWPVGAGSCLNFLRDGTTKPYGVPTAAGTSLQIVTTVGNGPVEVWLRTIRQ